MMKIDVVSARPAAVDVNHLLIEQIAAEQQQAFEPSAAVQSPQRGGMNAAIDGGNGRQRQQAISFGVLTISRDTRERSSCGASATSRTRRSPRRTRHTRRAQQFTQRTVAITKRIRVRGWMPDECANKSRKKGASKCKCLFRLANSFAGCTRTSSLRSAGCAPRNRLRHGEGEAEWTCLTGSCVGRHPRCAQRQDQLLLQIPSPIEKDGQVIRERLAGTIPRDHQ